jgi:O-antigen/teichoic acid export membrane protein
MTGIPIEQLETEKIKPLSLRANFSWTFAGNLIYAASQWGILVVLARLGSPEMVGQFALGLAISAPVILFANLQLRAVQATDATREYAFADYFGLRLLTTLLALLVIGAIIVLAGYEQETALVIGFIALAKAFEAISDVFFGLLQQHERMDRIAKSLIIEGPATLVVMGVVIWLTGSLVLATAAMALVWGLQLALYDYRSGWLILQTGAATLIRPRFRQATLWRLAWLALPLGFVMMLISLNTNIPRYFIEAHLGEAQLGIFAAMTYLIVAGTTIVSALGQSASPRLAHYYATAQRQPFFHLLRKLVGIGTALGVAGVIFALFAGELILNLFYGAAYSARADVFVWVMVGAGLFYVGNFLGYGITATRQFSRFSVPFAINTGLIAISAYLLTPRYGLQGAAFVVVISGILSCATPILLFLTNKEQQWIASKVN